MPPFNRIAIIGLGMIGGSVARAARAHRLAETIVGCDRNEVSLGYARKEGFIDAAYTDPAKAVKGCDLILLAAPPSALGDIAQAIAPHLAPGAIVSDACSVKQPAIEAIAPHLPEGIDFVPAHPIAGSQHTGVQASRADLFAGRQVIVTPDEPFQTPALQSVTDFWNGMGAHVEAMPPHLHDVIYAYVSHLPQLLAFALPDLAADEDDETLARFLRLRGSSPALWTDIFLLNRENVLAALDRYIDVIAHIEGELADAPQEEPGGSDEALARRTLFPRVVASCLITTIMEAERKTGCPFARYAGAGFADITAPAATPPEEDIEHISGQYRLVKAMLASYAQRLKKLRGTLAGDNAKTLEKALVKAAG